MGIGSTVSAGQPQFQKTQQFVSIGSRSSELRIMNRLFWWFPYSFRKILTKFEDFPQPFEPVFMLICGNQFSNFCWVASVLENTTVCFSWFSLIRAKNHAPFVL